jgi:hypothetical protein
MHVGLYIGIDCKEEITSKWTGVGGGRYGAVRGFLLIISGAGEMVFVGATDISVILHRL